MSWKEHLFVSMYFVMGFLTFGYFYNSTETQVISVEVVGECNLYTTSNYDRGLRATIAGVTWPIYWSGKAAIEVTK